MGQVLSLPFKLLRTTMSYWSGLWYYGIDTGRSTAWTDEDDEDPYSTAASSSSSWSPYLVPSTPQKSLATRYARVHLFGLTANLYLYNRPHYRKPTYRRDLIDNLRNVAVPGTGVPLSTIAWSRWIAIPYLVVAYPCLALVASYHYYWKTGGSISLEYQTRLLNPDDWFSFWRLNCIVVGLHAFLYPEYADEYEAENKWEFLQRGKQLGVPVSPYYEFPGIVVKHRNEEGGLGIYFYKNATSGGDWIIQGIIQNSDWVERLLPPNAPLSTFRVITASRGAYNQETIPEVISLSCVFRAGRQGAATDHDSILFDVDVTTGQIKEGTTNAHWYQLYSKCCKCPWRSDTAKLLTHHPDGGNAHQENAIPVTGNIVPDMAQMLELVQLAHARLCPHVPFGGWDVVLSKTDPHICLLEVNLSCNFFRGSFDMNEYVRFVSCCFRNLQERRMSEK
jgi:hypothetical protein